jgi:hypothetical protein
MKLGYTHPMHDIANTPPLARGEDFTSSDMLTALSGLQPPAADGDSF